MGIPAPTIDGAKIEDMLDRRGRMVQWEETRVCSCWNMDSGQPSYICKACNGRGFIYEEPIVAKAMVTSVELNDSWDAMAGMFEVGDAIMTVPKRIPIRNDKGIPTGNSTLNPLFEIGKDDRITLTDDEFKTSEILIRGMPIVGRPADTLANQTVTRVKSVRMADPVTGEITSYAVNTDYTLVNNTIEWKSGGASPVLGQQYSVTYFHRPTYTVVATLPKPRHQDGQDLPRYVALKYMSATMNRV